MLRVSGSKSRAAASGGSRNDFRGLSAPSCRRCVPAGGSALDVGPDSRLYNEASGQRHDVRPAPGRRAQAGFLDRACPELVEGPPSASNARSERRGFGLSFLRMCAAVALAGAFAAEDVQAKSFWVFFGEGGTDYNDGFLVDEGGRVSFTIRLSEAAPAGGLTFSLTAKYGNTSAFCPSYTAGAAEAADVRYIPATVTVPAGHRQTEATIAINSDTTNEGDECFQIDISTSTSGWDDPPWFNLPVRFRAGQSAVIIIRGANSAFGSGVQGGGAGGDLSLIHI